MLSAAARRTIWSSARQRHRLIGMAMLLPVACLNGCTMLDPNVPAPELELPNAYIKKSTTPLHPAASPYDFAVFKSHRLTELIALGRGFNLDISASIARVQQAEALVRIATMPLIPSVQAQGSASQSLSHPRGPGSAVRLTQVTAQLTASYELDFWGKNHAALNSAIANQYSSSFDSMTIAITTDANVANTYFDAIGTQKQIDIARQNLRIAERTLDAIKARFNAGTASGLDVAQQETLVANVKVTIPPLERQLEQFKHALAVLVGTAPEFFKYKGEDLYAVAVPKIPPGLPSELLCRRPDIAFAEAQLASQKFTVSSARAALFPSIQLTGAGGFQSVALASLFSPQSLFYNMAVNATQPITNAYQLQAILDQNRARYGELLEIYRKAIISAFQDVEDSLIAYQKNAEQERLQNMAVISARRAYKISETQLRAGIIDVTTLLQVQQTLFVAENQLALVRISRLQAAVSLYRALGGGWYKPPDTGIAEVPSLIEVKARTP
jgi:NodT family efflux transporter outer membrane factor (OMF) lipoprotein